MPETRKKRLGDVLRERGKISDTQLDEVITAQQGRAMRLGELLLERGLVSKEDIADALREVSRVSPAEFPVFVDPELLDRIPREVALRCCALPLRIEGRKLVMAMAEPQNIDLLDHLRFTAGMDVQPRFSFRKDVLAGIARFYGAGEQLRRPDAEPLMDGQAAALPSLPDPQESAAADAEVQFLTASSREMHREAMRELQAGMTQRTPAVRLVSNILLTAAEKKASDIHIEPHASGAIVRLRVDGMLRELMTVPPQHQAAVISRVKILADLDIAERRVPQDGRFLMQCRGQKMDLRVSTLPTHFGEKIVMRLLNPAATRVSFEQLGLPDGEALALRQMLALPQGMLLVTGPTGSGKSTTLYSALHLICTPGRNIITVEDPIEYMLDGVNQVQVNPKAGLNFANTLRSMLRQDPDVIMVGEIRDAETAEITMKATQTGHLVLSTLHTNDSVSAITRLLDLGVAPYLICASLTGVLAQRLVRKLCACRTEAPLSRETRERLLAAGIDDIGETAWQTVGCAACDGTGYSGRIGIYELLVFDEQIRSAIRADAGAEGVRRIARGAGFRTMQENAICKARQGETTLDEVFRVVPTTAVAAPRCHECARELLTNYSFCPYCGVARNVPPPAARQMLLGGLPA